jgi:hypothetical protein
MRTIIDRTAPALKQGATAAAVAAALFLGGALGAVDVAQAHERAGSKQQVSTQASAGQSTDRQRTKRAYLGRAPWICTPSGFGRTASCFQRASLK